MGIFCTSTWSSSFRSMSEKWSSAQGVSNGGGSRGAFDFPSSASKWLQTLPFTALTALPTCAPLHHHNPVHMQNDGCSCCAPHDGWHIYLTTHMHFIWHARCKVRLDIAQPGFPLTDPHVLGCSEIRVYIFCEFNWFRAWTGGFDHVAGVSSSSCWLWVI